MPPTSFSPTRRTALVAAAATAALALAGCSTGPTGSTAGTAGSSGAGGTSSAASTSSTAGADATAFPVTITHAFGTTTIDAAPQRVALAGWSDADMVLDLGVVPVGQPAITWGGNARDSTDWYDARLAQVGGAMPVQYSDAEGIPVDEIAKLQPDLILATNSGMTKEEYERLSKITKVVPYPKVPWGTPWNESLEVIGKALGRTTAATELATKTNAAIDAAKASAPDLAGKSAAWIWFTPNDLSTVGVYTSSDNRPAMLRSLGMKDAGIVTSLTAANPNAFSANVSAEKAETIDADVLIWYAEGAPSLEEMQKHPLLGKIPAVKRGSVVIAADNSLSLPMSSPTTLSIPIALEKFVPLVTAAAAKVTG